MINKLNKQTIRNQLLEKRRNLSYSTIQEKSLKIADMFLKFDKYQQSEKIMLYVSTKTEVQTGQIIQYSQTYHKELYVPYIDQINLAIIPSLVLDFEKELSAGSLGIMQPKEEYLRFYPPDVLDLVLVPGVGFTQNGERMGRGGGYYDKFLSKLPKDILTAGLAFEEQIVSELPIDQNDVSVDYIVTEERIIQIRTD